MKSVFQFLIAVCLLGGAILAGGCRLPSEQAAYDAACRALAEDARVPEGAVPADIGDARIYLAKNAGTVILPYRAGAKGGAGGEFFVKLKRVARTWTREESYPMS